MSRLPAQNDKDRLRPSTRTSIAIGLAAGAGVLIGVFSNACAAAPFGPVLLGMFVVLLGAVVLTAGLCVLATNRYVTVGVGYAAGVGAGNVLASITRFGIGDSWWGPPGQFGVVFLIVAFASLFGSLPCALLKWEDKRAREQARKSISDDQHR